ncbi:MAG: hypothetical protein FWH53_03585 [Leptospirales bacterium]|nr:hypothetical protein [Leptospirales bacterium]
MPDQEKFDFNFNDDFSASDDDFSFFDEDNSKIDQSQKNEKQNNKPTETENSSNKRTSADFSPDMEALLITAQSSMIIEAMKLISLNDFKAKNTAVFSEAINGIDLYIKILERNPSSFRKLMSNLSNDKECMDVQRISFNLFKNATGEIAETDTQKLRSFELVKERLKIAYNKCLVVTSIGNIKKYFLLSGSLDIIKTRNEINKNGAQFKNQLADFARHINIGRQLIQSKNSEITKGMKGKEINVFIVKATELLAYYFSAIGNKERQTYYSRLNENFKKYFIIR